MPGSLYQRIQIRLKKLGKTERSASLEADLSDAFIRNIRLGRSTSPRSDTIAKLAGALQTTEAWLLREEGPEEAASAPKAERTVQERSIDAHELQRTALADSLRQARRQSARTIRETATAIGVGIDELDSFENARALPTPEQFSALAQFFGVDRKFLEGGEVKASEGTTLGNASFVSDRMPAYFGPRDVEKLGVAAAGDDGDFEFNGAVAEYVPRPRGLTDRPGVFALEIISDSMYPAHRKGDIVFCDRTEPAIGDDVVIETFPDGNSTVAKSFVKRLKRRSASKIIVEQFNPPRDLTFDPYAIKHVWRVVPNRELHGY